MLMWVGAIVTWWCKPQNGAIKPLLVLSCENVSPKPLSHPEILETFNVLFLSVNMPTSGSYIKQKKLNGKGNRFISCATNFVTCEWILAFKKIVYCEL